MDTLRYTIFIEFFNWQGGGGGDLHKTMHFALNFILKNQFTLALRFLYKITDTLRNIFIPKKQCTLRYIFVSKTYCILLIPNYKRTYNQGNHIEK